MTKKTSRIKNFEEFDDDRYENGYHDQLVERRKLKRMKNALKSRDVNDLMNLDDYY